MSELPQNLVDDVPAGAEVEPQLPHFSVGGALRDARIESGMSVTEVSSRIKFAPRQIEALEADDYAQLPEIAFVRGFVRGYARLLALDADALLAALPQGAIRPAPEEANVLAEVPFPNAYSTRKPNIMWLGAGLGVAAVLGIFVWLHGGTSDVPEQQSQVMSLELPDAAPMTLENEAPAPMQAVMEPATTVAVVARPEMPAAPAATAIKPAPATATKSAPLAEVKPVLVKPVAEVAKPVAPTAPVVKPVVSAPPTVTVKPLVSVPVNPLPETAKTVAVKPVAALPAPVKPVANVPVDANAQGLALIHFAFDNESWVEVKDKNGKSLLGQLNAQGTELNVRGEPPFTLLIGNSGGVHLTYKGKSIDLAPHSSAQVAHLTLE